MGRGNERKLGPGGGGGGATFFRERMWKCFAMLWDGDGGGGRWGGGSCLKLLRSAGKTLLRSAGEKRPTVYCATCALVVLPATTRPRQANNNTARYQPLRYSRVMCLMLAPSGSKRACRALTAGRLLH